MDRAAWQFVNSFAEWASAAGTIAAVVVALRLARRQYAPVARVTFHGAFIVDGIHEPDEVYDISVVNTGPVEITVSSIQVKFQLRDRRRIYLQPSQHPQSARLPTRLRYGEVAHFFYRRAVFNDMMAQSAAQTSHWMHLPLFRRALRVGVSLSTGEQLWAPPGQRFDLQLRRAAS